MESLERSSAVIDLGKRLIAQLELGEDETAQWMAHMLAERIHDAENAPLESRTAAQDSCAKLVLQLWERRYSLPARLRPLEKLEPLLRTLDSLDANNGPRFRFMRQPPENEKVEEDIKQMLDAAVKLDDAARILVSYFLAAATEQASEEARSWIQSAADAGADVMLEARVVSFVDSGLDRSSDDAKVAREALKNKIRTLEVFSSLAASHAADLRAKHDLPIEEADDTEPSSE
ncbi:MAG: AVAST type 3 anti-phage protein Avs3b [Hydrogenophaga sp.]|nr:AVAST type 3 anti-phage protein Avs3b [Hydrogenophaga sp.]